MPTYEYACRDCGEHLEVVQSFTDDPLTDCGRCGGALRKVFSAAGIIFKGSGYYVTDSRSGEKTPAAASDKASDTASESATETSKSDSGTKESTSDTTAKSA